MLQFHHQDLSFVVFKRVAGPSGPRAASPLHEAHRRGRARHGTDGGQVAAAHRVWRAHCAAGRLPGAAGGVQDTAGCSQARTSCLAGYVHVFAQHYQPSLYGLRTPGWTTFVFLCVAAGLSVHRAPWLVTAAVLHAILEQRLLRHRRPVWTSTCFISTPLFLFSAG